MSKFENWSKENKTSIASRIATTMNPAPLREKISRTVFKLNMTQKKLEESRHRMQQKDRLLFTKCVRAQESKDTTISTMYANECAQIRKMSQTIMTSQLALEQVVLRLETVRDFGDIATEVVPAANIIHSIKGQLSGVIPEVSYQLGAIGSDLDSLVLEVGEATGMTWDVTSSGEEAEKILGEAAALAEQKTKEQFPALPTTGAPEKGISPPSIDQP